MTKEWKVHDEVYTMVWYYEDKLKELKNKRHDLLIEVNKISKMLNKFPSLSFDKEDKQQQLNNVEEELALTKSLLRRLKKLTEMYNIKC